MELTVRYLDGVKFDAETRGHHLVCDQPPSNGGEDAGMTPPELLVASLGTCAGFYAVQYLKTRRLPTEGLQVRITAEKTTGPARLGSFRIEVEAPLVDSQHEAGIQRAVKACLIHNTLAHAPVIETVVHAAPAFTAVK